MGLGILYWEEFTRRRQRKADDESSKQGSKESIL